MKKLLPPVLLALLSALSALAQSATTPELSAVAASGAISGDVYSNALLARRVRFAQ